MLTQAHSIKEIAKNTYEIGEFDCACEFLIIGEEKALLIDTGMGIGDLRGLVEKLTDKPITLVLSHGHIDHIGGMGWFDVAYLSRNDWFTMFNLVPTVEKRRFDAEFIAKRNNRSYDYDLDVDIRPWPAMPRIRPLEEGQTFDLGGRIVTAYECPGHTEGSMVFLDDESRILFAGDACNCNLLINKKPGTLGFVSIERALTALERVSGMKDKYDKLYNGHCDFRPFGEPLDESVLTNAIGCCQDLVSGNYKYELIPGMFPHMPMRTVVRRGTTMISYSEEGIHEPIK